MRARVSLPLIVSLIVSVFLSACHRTDFNADQTTVCPEPEGSLVVLDYTVNCLYVGDQPETGCSARTPHDYFYADTFICSERSGARNAYLQAVIDQFLDIDASVVDAAVSDMSVPFSDLTSTVDEGVDDGASPPTQTDNDTTQTDNDPTQSTDTADQNNDAEARHPRRGDLGGRRGRRRGGHGDD